MPMTLLYPHCQHPSRRAFEVLPWRAACLPASVILRVLDNSGLIPDVYIVHTAELPTGAALSSTASSQTGEDHRHTLASARCRASHALQKSVCTTTGVSTLADDLRPDSTSDGSRIHEGHHETSINLKVDTTTARMVFAIVDEASRRSCVHRHPTEEPMLNIFNANTMNTTPVDSKPLPEGTKAAFGFVSNVQSFMAESPELRAGYAARWDLLSKSTRTPHEQQSSI